VCRYARDYASVRQLVNWSPLVSGDKNDMKLVGLHYLEGDPLPNIEADKLVVQGVHGERTKQYLHVWRDWGANCRWYESLTLSDFRKLSATLPVKRPKKKLRVIKSTSMNRLLRALCDAIYERKTDCPDGMNPDDWRFNLRLAKRLVRKRPRRVLKDYGSVYVSMGQYRKVNDRGRPVIKPILCEYCHVPILCGFVLNGHKVKRSKKFCCDGCEKNFKRHRRR
jgi:hypothetical protein